MKISIIIPCYNAERYIEKCILSISQNDTTDYEIIAINDGSNDHTLDILYNLSCNFKNLKVIDIPNGGVSNARNIGLNQSKGEYILFVDADDTIKPNTLDNLINYIQANKVDIICFNHTEVYSENKKIERIYFNKNQLIDYNVALRKILSNEIPAGVWGKLINRDIILNNKIRFNKNLKLGEDLLFMVMCITQCTNVLLIKDNYYNYYMRLDSVTHKVSETVLTIADTLELIETYLKKNNMYQNYISEIEFLKFLHLYYYRVIVGPIQHSFHKIFYDRYDNKAIKKNKYYINFVSSLSFNNKLRIYMYERFPYKLTYLIHNLILKLLK